MLPHDHDNLTTDTPELFEEMEETSGNLLVVVSAIASMTFLGMTATYVSALMAVLMERGGFDARLTGLSYSLGVAVILLIGPWMPRLLEHFGVRRVFIVGIAVGLLDVLALAFITDPWGIFSGRIVLGGITALSFVTGETVINAACNPRIRGRVLGIYGAILALGLGIGPLLLRLTGTTGTLPFAGLGALLVLTVLPITLAGSRMPHLPRNREQKLWHVLALSPMAVLAAFAFGLLDGSAWALLPVYGLRAGFPEEQAVLLLTILLLGGMTVQLGIGWVADHMNHRRLLLGVFAACAVGAALVPSLATPHGAVFPLYTLVFIWGGLLGGVYTVGLVILGEKFQGDNLGTGTVVMVMTYSIGSLIGPPAAGAAMEWYGPDGFPYALALGAIMCFMLGLLRYMTRTTEWTDE